MAMIGRKTIANHYKDAKTGKEEAEAEEMAAVEAARQAEADAENGREELWS